MKINQDQKWQKPPHVPTLQEILKDPSAYPNAKIITMGAGGSVSHTNLQNEITGAYYEEKYTWKDYLYIVPPILLLVYIIIRSIL